MHFNKKILILLSILLLVVILTGCSKGKVDPIGPDSMTPEEKEIAMQEAMELNPPKELTSEERTEEENIADNMADGSSLRSGTFEGKVHPTSGDVQIIEKDGQRLLVLSENFKSDSGPRLHVILAENSNPKNSKELHEGQYIDLGILKSTSGVQTYVIPEGDTEKFNSVTIYCKPFKVLFGLAKL